MDKTDNIERLQDRKKRFLILFLFALLLGLIFTLATMYQKDRVMRVNNLEQARLIAGEIDQDNIKALKASDADLNTPNYERLKNNLSIIKNTTIKCRFLYLMGRRSDGKLFMYLDSEKKGSHDESPPGQLYEEASAGDIEAFETKKEISVGPVTDRWGAYISSLIPLVDRKTGEVTAVFGMDMDLEGWQKEILGAGVIPSIFSLLLMALVLAGYFLYSKKVNYGFGYKGLLQHVEIALACGAGIIITLAAAWTADKRQDQGFLESFSQLADNKIEMLSEKLNSFKKVELEGLAHYIERTKELSQKEFAGYTAYLTQDNRIQALEWVPVVSAKERAKYEKNAQLSGFSGYSFWEKDVDGKKIPAGPRELYYAVYNLNPIKGNEKSLGYDLGSETVRREALEEAVKSGLPAATDAVVLVQEKAAQKGLLIFRPVFTGENKKKIRGFALLVLRLEDFLKRTTGPVLNRNNSTVDIKLYQAFEDRPLPELTASSPAMILKGSEKEKTFYKREEFSVTRPLFIFDKVFILQLTPGSAFYSSYPKYSTGLTVLIGLILTGLMAFLFKLTINRKSELEQLVNERTNMLRQTEMRVAATLRSIGDGVISTDTKGCVVSLNNAAEKLTGWVWLEAHGRPI
ncbi:MAG: CHASE domain-containing protein, partial [Candidatus Firestonebacteria bacterium]